METHTHLKRRQLKALETKMKLFKTALNLFSEKGFDMVSVDEIAATAGTAKGSFYTYFKSKEQVIVEQFKQVDNLYVEIYNDLGQDLNATEKLMTLVREQQRFACNEMGLEVMKVVYYSQIKNSENETFFINENRSLYKILQEIITEGQQTGEFRDDLSVKELTVMIIRCMRGVLYDWCLYEGKFDIVEEGQKYFACFIEGIKAPSKI